MSTLSTSYDPKAVESQTYSFWEKERLFEPESQPQDKHSTGNAFSIVIPPPNVTGTLHMGHALDNTIQDILIRYHRMLGDKTLWMPGTDHAGIATQNVVERQLAKDGKSKHDLGREAFLKEVWDWANLRKGDILGQFKRLGISPDWNRQRFTLDEGLSKAVRQAFVHLYNKGLIYQGTYIVNWCPRCASAISDIETDYQDEESFLWEISYPLANQPGALVVATTRPETMFGDVAVAVHPEDARYKQFIGQNVVLPLTGRQIPVIADEIVEADFGTGALKITPAHDPNDFKTGLKHNLDPIWIMDEHGNLKQDETVPESLRGVERFEARKRTEQLLQEQGLLVRKKEHNHRVGHCQRCSTVIEPLLSKQWFVKTKPLAEKALQSLETGKIKFIPERWTKEYLRWMTDIQDWCISRQLWWGHTIPASYCNACQHVTVSETEPSQCSSCGSNDLQAETDVLDTWFSSGLWPFSTMGWPDLSAEDLKTYYPTSVLVTGFDIIFFWVARMTMFGEELTDQSPFHTVYIHGLIRDEKGQKMSKSKGNTIDPVEIIEQYGCDGFRFALTSLITYGGQDIKLAKDKIELGKLFCNKLWNASRFVMMNLEGQDGQSVDNQPIDETKLSQMDAWILSRYNATVKEANQYLQDYKFGELASLLYEFIWNSFCDWYVEYAKKQLRDEVSKANTQRILLHVLDGILKLMHPIMPFITEALWQKLPHRQSKSIMIEAYPQAKESLIQAQVQQDTDFVLETIRAIRNIRQQYNVPPSQPVNVTIEAPQSQERQAIESAMEILNHFVKLDQVDLRERLNGKPAQAAANMVGHSRILIPLEGLIDVKQELDRLGKKLEALKKEQDQLFKMMENHDFMEKAPPTVIEKNKTRLNEVNNQIKSLEEQYADMAN